MWKVFYDNYLCITSSRNSFLSLWSLLSLWSFVTTRSFLTLCGEIKGNINDSSFVGSGPLKKIVWILCCCKDKACAFLFVLDSENWSFLSSKRRIKLRLLWHHHYCFYLLLVLLSPPTTEIIRTTHDDDDDNNNTNTNTSITTNNNGTEAETKKVKQAIKQLLLSSKQRF